MELMIQNLSTGSELLLSESSLNFILESVDWGTVEAVHNKVTNTDTIGEIITDTFLNPRDGIQIVGWVVGSNQEHVKMRKDVLNKLINPKSEMKLIYRGYILKVKATGTVRYGLGYRENNDIMCKFTLNFIAPQPLFMLQGELLSTVTVITNKFSFPLVFAPTMTFGQYPDQSLENMNNIGDVPTGFVITLTATGAVTNPALLNNDTGQKIKLNTSMAAGDTIEISTLSGNKYVRVTKAGVTTNIIGRLTRDSVLFSLSPGVNHFELVADANVGNMEIGIQYAPRFLEVQE